MKIHIPKNTRDPDGDPIEPGDTLVYKMVRVEKPADADD